MTNQIALGLAFVLISAVALNFWFGWELEIFFGRKLLETVEWMAFWR